jgi:hypothetical protein
MARVLRLLPNMTACTIAKAPRRLLRAEPACLLRWVFHQGTDALTCAIENRWRALIVRRLHLAPLDPVCCNGCTLRRSRDCPPAACGDRVTTAAGWMGGAIRYRPFTGHRGLIARNVRQAAMLAKIGGDKSARQGSRSKRIRYSTPAIRVGSRRLFMWLSQSPRLNNEVDP